MAFELFSEFLAVEGLYPGVMQYMEFDKPEIETPDQLVGFFPILRLDDFKNS